MLEMLKIAVRNLTRKSMRTWLTIASISIGIASVVVIGAIGDAGKQRSPASSTTWALPV